MLSNLLIIYLIGVLGSLLYFSREIIGESNALAAKYGKPALSPTPLILLALIHALLWPLASIITFVEKRSKQDNNV